MPTTTVKRELEGRPLAVEYTVRQLHTEPMDDLSAMRVRPYIRAKNDDVAYCIVTVIQWDKTVHYHGVVRTIVRAPPA